MPARRFSGLSRPRRRQVASGIPAARFSCLRRNARLPDPPHSGAARAGRNPQADGYARATVRSAWRSPPPVRARTNMVPASPRHVDSSPNRVHHRPGRQRLDSGPDAFQETDITHHPADHEAQLLVTRADEVAPAVREPLPWRAWPSPGPVLIDITKDAQLGSASSTGKAPPRPRIARSYGHSSGVDPIALVNGAQRPLILAGHASCSAVPKGHSRRCARKRRFRLP